MAQKHFYNLRLKCFNRNLNFNLPEEDATKMKSMYRMYRFVVGYDFYPMICLFSIPEPLMKIIFNHKAWKILLITFYSTIYILT